MEARNVFDLQRNLITNSYTRVNKTRRVVFYGRVSTEHEAQISALENQIQWYYDQAEAHKNWVVLDKYIDEGITGTQAKKRPSFLRMLEDARKGKFDLVVTREVCRFARNTVDTLVVTRELKNLGIEVYFVEDNIWTMDGDGELRLTIMATLAQEESRKVSERVRAGQHISREKGVIYGSGNILGYDRVGKTYVINKTQAETVRRIYDLYLQEEIGITRIADILIKEGRLTATGTLKWSVSNVSRILNNPTYMGVIAYGKSYSNNYLDQKRINNPHKDTYIYKKLDFEPIVTEEEYWKVQEIKLRRTKELPCTRTSIFGEEHVKGPVRENRDKWGAVLRCGCGAHVRKNRWHVNKSKPWSYGYQCYNQLNNGSGSKMRKNGADDTDYCDISMTADWKLEFMGLEIFKSLWSDKKAVIEEACDIIKKCYAIDMRQADEVLEAKKRLAKLQQKISNLREMRLEGDIGQQEFKDKLNLYMKEESEIQAEIDAAGKVEKKKDVATEVLDYDKIRATLEEMLNFESTDEEGVLDKGVVQAFVSRVTKNSNNEYTWYLNLTGKALFEVNAILEGRKKKATLSIYDTDKNPITPMTKEDTESFFRLSDLKQVAGDNSLGEKASPNSTKHRLLSTIGRTFKIYYRMTLDETSARAYRESRGQYLRHKQWEDISVNVYVI